MKRILVTGGAGFIGSHLCRALIHQGHHVICLDNFYTGVLSNISDLQNHSNFEIINHDVSEVLTIKAEQIYNCACPASPIHYQKHPVRTITTCVLGMKNLLDLALKNNCPILQCSTSEVYGSPTIHPQTEDYWGNVNPIGPRSCYDEGKRCAETLCFDYHREHGIDIKVARIFNTYGPNMSINDGRVVSNLIVQALKNEMISIYGDGSQTRSFCYISDMITALISLMNQARHINGPINLGNPHEISIIELASLIIKLTESQSKLIYQALPKDDPKQRQPDITLAKKQLNWQPEIKLEIGLEKTIDNFRTVLKG
jgi:UDP-glucuronate decarboxylase